MADRRTNMLTRRSSARWISCQYSTLLRRQRLLSTPVADAVVFRWRAHRDLRSIKQPMVTQNEMQPQGEP